MGSRVLTSAPPARGSLLNPGAQVPNWEHEGTRPASGGRRDDGAQEVPSGSPSSLSKWEQRRGALGGASGGARHAQVHRPMLVLVATRTAAVGRLCAAHGSLCGGKEGGRGRPPAAPCLGLSRKLGGQPRRQHRPSACRSRHPCESLLEGRPAAPRCFSRNPGAGGRAELGPKVTVALGPPFSWQTQGTVTPEAPDADRTELCAPGEVTCTVTRSLDSASGLPTQQQGAQSHRWPSLCEHSSPSRFLRKQGGRLDTMLHASLVGAGGSRSCCRGQGPGPSAPGTGLAVGARHPETRPLANGSPSRPGLRGSGRAGRGSVWALG